MHALLIVGPSKLYCSPVGIVWQYAIGNVKNAELKKKKYMQWYIHAYNYNSTGI